MERPGQWLQTQLPPLLPPPLLPPVQPQPPVPPQPRVLPQLLPRPLAARTQTRLRRSAQLRPPGS